MKHSSNTVEWYTPPKLMELVRQVSGDIDLDPASCKTANQFVKANRIYTKEQDGLVQDWGASTVWLNPPYDRSGTQLKFVKKAIEENELQDYDYLWVLVNSNTSAQYYQLLLNNADALCLFKSRIRFIDYQGIQQARPQYSNSLFLFTNRTIEHTTFLPHFSSLGYCIDLYQERYVRG